MKIMFVANNLSGTSGWGRYSRDIIFELSRNGHDICVISEKKENNFDNVKFVEILDSPLSYMVNFFESFIAAKKINKIIKEFDPEIIHFAVEPYATIIPFLKINKSKLVLTVHGTYYYIPDLLGNKVKKIISILFSLYIYNKVDKIIAVSSYTAERLYEKIKNINKIQIIKNGVVYKESYSVKKIDDKVKNILFVGAIKKRKGLLQSIKALDIYKKNISDKFVFNIVGFYDKNDTYFQSLVKLVNDLNLNNNVVFHGRISDKELDNYLSNADLFLMPSVNSEGGEYFEGFGLVYLEANAKGVPVIGSLNSGARDAIFDGYSGYLVDPSNIQNVCEKIKLILVDKTINFDNCVSWAQKNTVKDRVVDLCSMYKTLLEYNTKIKRKKVVISAAYGMGNIGDEAILETIVNDLTEVEKDVDITVLVFDRKKFFTNHDMVFWENRHINIKQLIFNKKHYFCPSMVIDHLSSLVCIFNCDLFIWGGGGIIRNRPDWLYYYMKALSWAQFFCKKIIVHTIGIDKITKTAVKEMVEKIKKVDVMIVRDGKSRDNFLEVNKKINDIRVIPDPVFHFRSTPSITHVAPVMGDRKIRVGINVTSYNALSGEDTGLFLKNYANILKKINESGLQFTIVYLPTAKAKDDHLFEEMCKNLGGGIAVEKPNILTPQDYINCLSDCDCFIGMRMHSLILASRIKGLPILSIVYSDKVKNLFLDINFNNFVNYNDIVSGQESACYNIENFLKKYKEYVFDFSSPDKKSRDNLLILKNYL